MCLGAVVWSTTKTQGIRYGSKEGGPLDRRLLGGSGDAMRALGTSAQARRGRWTARDSWTWTLQAWILVRLLVLEKGKQGLRQGEGI